jgi:hypothetical protein
MLLPLLRMSSTTSALYCLENARRFLFSMTHSYRILVRSGVSTRPGQPHPTAPGWLRARTRKGRTRLPSPGALRCAPLHSLRAEPQPRLRGAKRAPGRKQNHDTTHPAVLSELPWVPGSGIKVMKILGSSY